MERTLPENASLEHLKSQAKDLLSDLRKADPSAKLHEAQLRLARDHGYASWPKLVQHVEGLQLRRLERSAKVKTIESGLHESPGTSRAVALLEAEPDLAHATLACAMVALDESAPVDTGNVNTPTGAMNTPPMAYACFSPLAPSNLERLRRIVRQLLALGADPNTSYQGEQFPDNPFSVLYGAAGYLRDAPLTEMLLQAGADPDDNESLYHATETRDHSCLKLLLAAHPKKDHHYALLRMLDFEDMAGLNLMLDAGCDPNKHNALAHAIRRGRSTAILRRLIEAGAKFNVPDVHGLTVQQMLFERGHDLPEIMGGFVPSPTDELLRACWAGDVGAATRLWTDVSKLPKLRQRAFTDAMWEAKAETVDAFIAGGFNWENRDDSRGTPLHCACFQGSLPTVKALLRHNPPLDDRKDMYDAIPLQWAAYSSQFHSAEPDRDFVGIVRVLAEAGSPPPDNVFGHPDVQAVLLDFWPDLPLRDEA